VTFSRWSGTHEAFARQFLITDFTDDTDEVRNMQPTFFYLLLICVIRGLKPRITTVLKKIKTAALNQIEDVVAANAS